MGDFKKGDLVLLKSGGPIMTVHGKHAFSEGLICVWFSQNKKNSEVFDAEMLESYQAPQRRAIRAGF